MTLIVVLLAGVLYAVFDLFVSKGSSANAYLANAVFNGLASLIPLLIVLPALIHHHAGTTSKTALVNNIIAGVVLTIFSVILVKLFAHGEGLGYILPVIYGTAIVVGALLGRVFLKEQISLLQITGILLTAVGISLVAVAKH
jgi:drug/metabolite transporter (DMT)-like permease